MRYYPQIDTGKNALKKQESNHSQGGAQRVISKSARAPNTPIPPHIAPQAESLPGAMHYTVLTYKQPYPIKTNQHRFHLLSPVHSGRHVSLQDEPASPKFVAKEAVVDGGVTAGAGGTGGLGQRKARAAQRSAQASCGYHRALRLPGPCGD